MKTINNYIQLTKPTIMLLVVITGAAALLIEGSLINQPFHFFMVLFTLYLTGGSANAMNQYLERDIDAKMIRTSKRRPLPQGAIAPARALAFAISIGVTGVLIFGFMFNWLTAGLSLATILFYSLVYTLWLKPNTSQNIVIGGIAGSMAPVGAWAAATGRMDLIPWIMFLIIFFWTPPHFWALALFYKDDYIRAKLPMMPVIKGEDITLKHILFYSIILVLTSLTLVFTGSGWIYLAVAIFLGYYFIKKSIIAKRSRKEKDYRSLFGYSIVYLFGLFIAMVVDNFTSGVF